MAKNVMYPGVGPVAGSRVRWGAIIAGLLITLASQVLLSLLGLAIGLSALNPAEMGDYSNLEIGSVVWLILTTFVSILLGAMAAAWLSNSIRREEGILHGVLTWGLFLLLTLFLLSSGTRSVLGGAFNLASARLSGTASEPAPQAAVGSGTVAPRLAVAIPLNETDIQIQLTRLMGEVGPDTGVLANLNASPALKTEIARRIATGDDTGAADLITRNSGVPRTRAMNLVEGSKRETRAVAQQVTDTASRVAWTAFGAVLLSFLASLSGGVLGAKSR